jgi:DNA polymerase III epsilon subunit-like protein
MKFIIVDVEADGPIPGKYSIVSFGAVVLNEELDQTFYGKVKPISVHWRPDALSVSGVSRDEHEHFEEPALVFEDFEAWLRNHAGDRPVFISDNLAFDWQWINFYFHTYLERNPFGFSGRRIGDLYCGMKMNTSLNHEWKKRYRRTRHDHNPVNDAIGNAEALLEFKKQGLKIPI